TVSFGGTPATSFTVNSSTQITAVAPAHSVGTVLVRVTTAGGTSNGVAYTYIAVPALTAIAPNAGPVTGGTTVVLTGTALTAANAVNFGGTPATSFTIDSATQITAVAPAGVAGTVQVTVTTGGGTSNSVGYTYVNVPTLLTGNPDLGPEAGEPGNSDRLRVDTEVPHGIGVESMNRNPSLPAETCAANCLRVAAIKGPAALIRLL
uniref:IPT/TIG domain-containing protein n=1 Tax=Nocardia brevicatena TaxID=37327 RepID=UPI0014614DA4